MATSAASCPVAIKTRPTRGSLWPASNDLGGINGSSRERITALASLAELRQASTVWAWY